MGSSLSTSPLTLPSAVHRLTRVLTLVRYRFFLFAGLLPYLLGAAWSYSVAGVVDVAMFWSGLGGVVFAVIGVEAYNEYFDARMGTDRVFNPQEVAPVTDAVFWIGTVAFAAALAVGIYLTALVPGLLIMALAVVNAIPDFHQDRLVGKRNLVVRLGRERAVWLYLILAAGGLMTVAMGVAVGAFPTLCLATLLALPWLIASGICAVRTFATPRQFLPAMRHMVGCYVVAVTLLTGGVLLHTGHYIR
jgi:1,4-dihydroxy-2-naphthoate octaprenyltransferase